MQWIPVSRCQLFGGFEARPEELIVQETAIHVAVDQRADEAVVAHGALQLGRGGVGVAHRQGGESEEPVRIRRAGVDHRVVGLPGQFDGQRYLDGLDSGHVGEDLHVETGCVHRGDPLFPRSVMPGGGQPPPLRDASKSLRGLLGCASTMAGSE
jgi:hypothetical protein